MQAPYFLRKEKGDNIMKQPSIIGGACVIAGVCVGAGMLGLPTAGVGAWTFWSMFAITLTMVFMTASGWLLLEAYQHYKYTASFNTVTRDLLGPKLNVFNNVAVYFVGAILLYAYITSSGLIISGLVDIDAKRASVLFVLIFSAFVWYSTSAVSKIEMVLIAFMVLFFVFGVSGLAMNVDFSILFDTMDKQTSYSPYVLAMFPVALTSFGYHHSVASMRHHYQEERRAGYAILGGTVIALFLYFLWMVSVYGNLPRSDFGPVIEQGGNVDALLSALGDKIQSDNVSNAINAFSMAAILSSFIGVGLGLFDFLADMLGFDDSRKGRTKTWLVTFLPPLICSLAFPFGFVIAIGYAGAAATVWTCLIPALLAFKTRKRYGRHQSFQVVGGNGLLIAVFAFGVLTAIFHFMAMAGWLPEFTL